MNLAASDNPLSYKSESAENFPILSQLESNNPSKLGNIVVDDSLFDVVFEVNKLNSDNKIPSSAFPDCDLATVTEKKPGELNGENISIGFESCYNENSESVPAKHSRSSDDYNDMGDDYDSDKNTRKRYRLTVDQTEKLNEIFEHNSKPDSNTRIELGKKLGMDPRKVQIWFQNRRAKLKRESNVTNNSQIFSATSMQKIAGSGKFNLQMFNPMYTHNHLIAQPDIRSQFQLANFDQRSFVSYDKPRAISHGNVNPYFRNFVGFIGEQPHPGLYQDSNQGQEPSFINNGDSNNISQCISDISGGYTKNISCYDLYNDTVPVGSVAMDNNQISYNIGDRFEYEKGNGTFEFNEMQGATKAKQNNLYDSAVMMGKSKFESYDKGMDSSNGALNDAGQVDGFEYFNSVIPLAMQNNQSNYTPASEIYESRKSRLESIVSLNSCKNVGFDHRAGADSTNGAFTYGNSISNMTPAQSLNALIYQASGQNSARNELSSNLNAIANQNYEGPANGSIETDGMLNQYKQFIFESVQTKELTETSALKNKTEGETDPTKQFETFEQNALQSHGSQNIGLNGREQSSMYDSIGSCAKNSNVLNGLSREFDSKACSQNNNSLLDDIFVKLNDPLFLDFQQKNQPSKCLQADEGCNQNEISVACKLGLGGGTFGSRGEYEAINNCISVGENKTVDQLAVYSNCDIGTLFHIPNQTKPSDFSASSGIGHPGYAPNSDQIHSTSVQFPIQAHIQNQNQHSMAIQNYKLSESSPFLGVSSNNPKPNAATVEHRSENFMYSNQANFEFESGFRAESQSDKPFMYKDSQAGPDKMEDMRLSMGDISIDGLINN